MTRTVWLAAGACVALAGVLALVWFAGSGAPKKAPPRVAPRPSPAPSDTPSPAVDLAGAQAPVEPDPMTVESEPTPVETERTEVEEVARPSGDVFALRIVEHGSPDPVAGADVHFRWSDGEEEVPWDYDELEEFLAGAQHARTDGAGVVHLPRAGRRLFVVAQKGRLWGRDDFELEDGDETDLAEIEELSLALDWSLVVQVLDAAGEPAAGVPVALKRSQGRWRHWSWDEETAGEEGLARFGHVGFRMADDRGDDDEWRVELQLVLLEPVVELLDPDAPPRERVVLSMPPTGEVEVAVFEADGSPTPDGTPVELGIVREGEPRDISPFSRLERVHHRRETEDGTALYRHVELGQELEVLVSHEGSRVQTREYARGPDVAGERARITVQMGQEHPVLVFRALDEAGAPLADRELSLRMAMRSQFMSNAWDRTTTTDAEGFFSVDVDSSYEEGDSRFLTVRDEAGEEPTMAHVDLRRTFTPGIHDMGDLRLGAAPILVAGRVERLDGSAVAGARIDVQVGLRREDGGNWWERPGDGEVRTGEDGTFEVRGVAPGDELFVTAKKEGLRGDFQVTSTGTRSLVLVLQDTGGLAGSVRVDEDVPLDDLTVKAERFGAPDLPEGMYGHGRDQARPGAEGQFTIDDLVPGTYRVDVRLQNEQDALVTFEAVTVQGGEPTRDPRLQAIDLRGRLHVHELVLVPPTPGEGVKGTLQMWESGSEGGRRSWRWFEESPVALVTPFEVIDVELGVRGYRSVVLEGVRGGREVRLDAGLPVRLVLRTDGEVPEPPYYVKAVLVPAEGQSHMSIDWGAPCFDETREIRTRAYATGRMRVQWVLEKRAATGGAVATTRDVEPEQFVEVLDTPAEQTIEVVISAEQLAEITKGL